VTPSHGPNPDRRERRTWRALAAVGWPRTFVADPVDPARGTLQRGGRVTAVVFLDAWTRYTLPGVIACRNAVGRPHGPQLELEDGRLTFVKRFEDGVLRSAEQIAPDGGTWCRSRFVDGFGTEVRFHPDGSLWELEWRMDGRLWTYRQGPVTRPLEEVILLDGGTPHGPHRRWSALGELEAGYPKWFVSGVEVAGPDYDRARAADPTLRPRLAADDVPERSAPDLSRVWLRTDVRAGVGVEPVQV
jgi:hypothetical protein